MRDGTSQKDRTMPALKEGYINVDEMKFEDLLAMAADYARILKYYDLNNASHEDWEPFFISDEAVIIAMILATDLDSIESDFSRFLAEIDRNVSVFGEDYNLENIPTYGLAKKIDFWYNQLQTTESEAGRNLGDKIAEVIEEKLRRELQLLEDFLTRDGITEEKFREGFNNNWFERDEAEILPRPVPSPSDDKDTVESFLKSNFFSFFNTILMLRNSAEDLLPTSLKSQTHSPAVALYIAFIKLFQKAQQKINRFTQRHLDFYYDDILKIKPNEISPDSTYLILRPDVEEREVFIEKGAEFLAGVDENDQDVIYTADNELRVNSAKVASLYTLYFEQNPWSSPEKELKFASRSKIDQMPVLMENGTRAGEDLNAFPLFGGPKSDAEGQPLKDAEIGFAIASPVLLLKEGRRDISFKFRIDYKDEGLDYILETVKGILGTNERDAFFKVFRNMFTICFTTENGWYEVPEYLPLSYAVDDKYEKDCLIIRVGLSPDVDPIAPYSAEVHGGQYDTELPLVRFTINPTAYLYPYSFLKNIIIKEIEIDVDVEGVREVLLYNNLGQLDPNSPFNPFGPIPSVGSYFIIGNPEVARKQITRFEVDVEWGDTPLESGGFKEYYQAYGMPFDNSIFEAGVTVLKDGNWLPYEEREQPKVKLFASEDNNSRAEERYGIKKKRLSLGEDVTKFYKPLETTTADDEFSYSSLAKGGFFKFTLANPEYAFGHKDYPLMLTNVLTANAKLKHPRLFRPIPKPPYTPLINAISINYKAVSTINLENTTSSDEASFRGQLFRIHPFGLERISPASYRGIYLLPQYNSAGNLFIGLSAQQFSGMITLFFHMSEDSAQETDAAPSECLWYYLSSNKWQRLEKHHLVSDTTNGFITSGIVTLNVPGDINRDNTIMPEDLFWLRVSVDRHPERLGSVYSIHTQALKVSWQYREDSVAHLQRKLPAGTIKEARISIPGIGGIVQIVESFGGSPTESREDLKTRIRERLKHKNRASTPWDYERLILERFPEIFKVKCFSNMVAAPEPENRLCPGHILIVVIPRLKEQPSENLKLMADRLLLREIREFVEAVASPFAQLEVRNPAYERLQVRCTVKFRSSRGVGDAHYVNVLNQAIVDYISPWTGTGLGAQFGWCIRLYDIESYISHLEYVDFVTNFSMLHITDKGNYYYRLFDTVSEGSDERNAEEIHPVFPWSIAIPFRRHFIETMVETEFIEPRITGINELAIGRTFIISGNQSNAKE